MKSSARPLRRVLSLAIALAIGLGISIGWASSPTISVSPNIKVIKDNSNAPCPAGTLPDPTFDCNNRQQVEPYLAVDPKDPNILVAGAFDLRMLDNRAIGNFFENGTWFGYYRSTDGGKTWSNSFIPGFPKDNSPEGNASPLKGLGSDGDSIVVFDNLGNVYYGGLASSRQDDFAFVSVYSDHGAKYERTTLAFVITGFPDKPCMVVDTTGGPNNGNLYIAVTRFGVGSTGATVAFSRSTDHGVTFSPLQTLTGENPQGCALAVGPKGEVYLTWRVFSGAGDVLKLAKSTDGGQSFSSPVSVRAINPFDQARTNPTTFRSTTFPTIAADDKAIYIAWHDAGSGKGSRIVISCSSDGGQGWSAPVQVTSDAQSGHQIIPALTLANGKLRLAWYDSRNDSQFAPNRFIGNTLDVYYAEAPAGCPLAFPATSVRVTDKSFNPNLRHYEFFRENPFIGDYIGIASDGTRTQVMWTDNRDITPQQPPNNVPCDFFRPELNNSGCRNQNIYMATVTSNP
ncbi:exo-alpha-sialidase [Candidatus Acetothermia bacterium]|nr:exo-alpha-sialidase [Candidatus Acetothermia bacterium]